MPPLHVLILLGHWKCCENVCDWEDIRECMYSWSVGICITDIRTLCGNFDPYTVANCHKTLIPVDFSIIYWWKYNVMVLRILWIFCFNAVDLFICVFVFPVSDSISYIWLGPTEVHLFLKWWFSTMSILFYLSFKPSML